MQTIVVTLGVLFTASLATGLPVAPAQAAAPARAAARPQAGPRGSRSPKAAAAAAQGSAPAAQGSAPAAQRTPTQAAPDSALGKLGRAHAAFVAGDYDKARTLLDGLAERLPRVRDHALYLAAESAFFDEAPARARVGFEKTAALRSSRFAAPAAWRIADCLWAEGNRAAAAERYRKLLAARTPGGDPALARFHLAELAAADAASKTGSQNASTAGEAAARAGDEARRLFRMVHVDHPSHPLADEAVRRLNALPASPGAGAVTAAPTMAAVTPAERLRRAAALSEGRQWQAALDEANKLPSELPPEVRTERDYLVGMTKYHMRRDYLGASTLLLGAVDRLPVDKAASAAFHGARALSRADRDDDAIVGYDRVVQRFPNSKFAAEAQFLAGWLDFNRGRHRQALPRLEATLARFPRTEFALDAAWFIALARHLLDEPQPALAALADYERRLQASGRRDTVDAAGRIAYFRGRLQAKLHRPDDERTALRAIVQRAPLSYYGLLARSRLEAAGDDPAWNLPPPTAAAPVVTPRAARDPAVVVADDLLAAGLGPEAGQELARAEAALLKRLGPAEGAAVLLDRHRRAGSFRRPYYLAETRGASALATAPAAGARPWWEASYPLAYRPLVERFGPPAGNPDYLIYAIMRKESGFDPHDTSYADARGLLQMIPTTSARVAKDLDLEFHADELYDPETNVRLGATYIGSLHRKFRGQVPLTAGAFNAGPRAMARWCDVNRTRPLDEFVELVTYEQTREYIKRVIAIYARYRFLYDGKPWVPPMTLDCRAERTGPDF